MRKSIRINEVRNEYIEYLSSYQKHISTQTDENFKRKYIGIVLEVSGIKYFAPLSSFKDKHKKMKESVDFIKIKDYAVINLNNMIPVPDSQIVNININKEKNASYRYLLQARAVKSIGKRTVFVRMRKLCIVIKNIMVFQLHLPKERMILNCWRNFLKNIEKG
ncbi:MAG: type III toxin-antitoxin system ToxN/AbiQ family toxin [Lachnospiraceae bacterium]|nr:type III toxin-antitoxin system ToxN/AbiQ family toxin [Lachnospiraceae bacterium]